MEDIRRNISEEGKGEQEGERGRGGGEAVTEATAGKKKKFTRIDSEKITVLGKLLRKKELRNKSDKFRKMARVCLHFSKLTLNIN